MGRHTQRYDTKSLFMAGLLAWRNIFSNIESPVKYHLTKRQQRVRRAFKAARIARRKQRGN